MIEILANIFHLTDRIPKIAESMFENKSLIATAIIENRRLRRLPPFSKFELEREVEALIMHASFVNEIGRSILWNEFRAGAISLAAFKQRAATNQPLG